MSPPSPPSAEGETGDPAPRGVAQGDPRSRGDAGAGGAGRCGGRAHPRAPAARLIVTRLGWISAPDVSCIPNKRRLSGGLIRHNHPSRLHRVPQQTLPRWGHGGRGRHPPRIPGASPPGCLWFPMAETLQFITAAAAPATPRAMKGHPGVPGSIPAPRRGPHPHALAPPTPAAGLLLPFKDNSDPVRAGPAPRLERKPARLSARPPQPIDIHLARPPRPR